MLAILNDNPLGDQLFTDLLSSTGTVEARCGFECGPATAARYRCRAGKRRGHIWFEWVDQRYGIWQCGKLTGTGELVLRRSARRIREIAGLR
jgi:hypothetical protein